MYNCKVINFANGTTQIRFYSKRIMTKQDGKKNKKGINQIETPFGTLAHEVKEISPPGAKNEFVCKRVSTNRAKNKVYEFARSNSWDWFLTWTFNPEKIDRYNFDECSKKIRKWLNNTRTRKCPCMKYVVVPEQHKDGAWHFHGLMSGIDNLPKTLFKGDVYTLDTYSWGYTTASPIKDTRRASSYVAKYISKQDLDIKGKQRYYVSKNLEQPNIELLNLENPLELYKLINSNKKEISYTHTVANEYANVTYLELSSRFIIADSNYSSQPKTSIRTSCNVTVSKVYRKLYARFTNLYFMCPVIKGVYL